MTEPREAKGRAHVIWVGRGTGLFGMDKILRPRLEDVHMPTTLAPFAGKARVWT